jgi:hypothetical protein
MRNRKTATRKSLRITKEQHAIRRSDLIARSARAFLPLPSAIGGKLCRVAQEPVISFHLSFDKYTHSANLVLGRSAPFLFVLPELVARGGIPSAGTCGSAPQIEPGDPDAPTITALCLATPRAYGFVAAAPGITPQCFCNLRDASFLLCK